jgi:flagellar motor switch protein FliG
VLALLEPEDQAGRRHARRDDGRDAAGRRWHQIEAVMKQKLSTVIAAEYSTAGGVKSLADILNHVRPTTERNVLDQLAASNGELADEVRLLLLPSRTSSSWTTAPSRWCSRRSTRRTSRSRCAACPRTVKQRIFGNMSERGAELLQEEIDFQPPQRRRVIEEAQGRIVGIVRRLEEAGAIILSRGSAGGGDELM